MSKYKLSTFDIDVSINDVSEITIEIEKFNNGSYVTITCETYIEWEHYDADDWKGMVISDVSTKRPTIEMFCIEDNEVSEETFKEINNLDDKEFKDLCDTCKNFAENVFAEWIYDHESDIEYND